MGKNGIDVGLSESELLGPIAGKKATKGKKGKKGGSGIGLSEKEILGPII